MKRYLLDSGILNDFINRRLGVAEKVREAQQQGSRIGTCTPVVAEMLYGLEFSSTRDENRRRLQRALSRLVCWTFDRAAAEEYGRVAAGLQRIGRRMQTIDTMIAAIAFSLGNCTVVSKDSDLAAVPGLAVENWAA